MEVRVKGELDVHSAREAFNFEAVHSKRLCSLTLHHHHGNAALMVVLVIPPGAHPKQPLHIIIFPCPQPCVRATTTIGSFISTNN